MNLTRYNKAYVPILVGIIIPILGAFDLTPEMTLEQVVTLIVTSLGVYFVPNR